MTDSLTRSTSRRAFLGRAAVAGASAAAVAAVAATPAALRAASTTTAGAPAPDDRWLDRLTGTQRAFFDMPFPAGGLPIVHVGAYLDSFAADYGLRHPEVSAGVSLYYMTTLLAFTDPVWAKYGIGKLIDVTDAQTGEPALRNVFWKPRGAALPVAGPEAIPNSAAITELQQRGATFYLCNNALNFWAGAIAGEPGAKAAAVREELELHLIPDVVIVPAMVIAFSKAQQRGVTYQYLP